MFPNHRNDIPLPQLYSIEEEQVTVPVHTQGEGITQGYENKKA